MDRENRCNNTIFFVVLKLDSLFVLLKRPPIILAVREQSCWKGNMLSRSDDELIVARS